jgi:hypothetical protein
VHMTLFDEFENGFAENVSFLIFHERCEEWRWLQSLPQLSLCFFFIDAKVFYFCFHMETLVYSDTVQFHDLIETLPGSKVKVKVSCFFVAHSKNS